MAAKGLLGLRSLADGEIDPIRMRRPRPFAIAEPVIAAADLHDVKRLHDRIIEALGGGNVGDGDGDVVKHRRPAAARSASRILALRATAASRFSFSSSTISSGALATNFSLPSLASTRLMSASALAISLSSRRLLGGEIDDALERQRRDLAADQKLHRALRRAIGEGDIGQPRHALDDVAPARQRAPWSRRRRRRAPAPSASPARCSSRRAPSGSR